MSDLYLSTILLLPAARWLLLHHSSRGQAEPPRELFAVSRSGGTLHLAALGGDLALVRQLLRMGADVRAFFIHISTLFSFCLFMYA